MSDDEFDNIPDEFADIQGIDWAALLCAPGSEPAPATTLNETPVFHGSRTAMSEHERIGASPIPESRSSVYFSDGSSNVDLAFLTELDLVEQQILFDQGGPSSKAARTGSTKKSVVADTSHHVQNVTTTRIPSSRNGKAKAIGIQDILSTYEDELTCPICCDLLVAAHIGNPCGHTFCGECGWQWHVEKRNKGCPCCRQELDKSMPMIPNIAMENMVDNHVKALAISGATEWECKGRKYTEWISRKSLWRQEAKKRENRKRRGSPNSGGSWVPVELFDPPDEWIDPSQDSDMDLIPRPIRRIRRRQGTTLMPSGTAIYELV